MIPRNQHTSGNRVALGAPAPARVNWWLRTTSFGWNEPQLTIDQRELTRRSQLASWIILGLLVADVVLAPIAGSDTASFIAIAMVGLSLVFALFLNRSGRVGAAATLIVIVIAGAVLGALVSEPSGLLLDALPAYDLLVVSLVVAATVLPRGASFIVAAINIALICLDYFLQPHAVDLQRDYATYPSPTVAALSLLARPIALQIVVATVAFLWVRGTDEAIRRADRAEELAALEHNIVVQRQQLEIGVQQILETHVRIANGDYSARAPMIHDSLLWQIASSLNNLMSRLQKSGYAEHQLRRTEEEIRRLAAAIDDAAAGKRPIWPAPSGTATDLIIERVTGRTRPAAPAPFMAAAQQRPPLPPGYMASSQGMPQTLGGPLGTTGVLRSPGTGPLEERDFPAWQPSGPLQYPTPNPQPAPNSRPNPPQENPWFTPPDA